MMSVIAEVTGVAIHPVPITTTALVRSLPEVY